ncbi:MAG TPA: hypothetical protein VJN89_21970 [Candidatus Acidoferrum sp.]|nr:hypothetical protein [Candidatus Acidoferrum sp.]
MLLKTSKVLDKLPFQVARTCGLIAGLTLVSATVSVAQQPPAPCVVEIPVYGPSGDRLSFQIESVSPKGNSNVNLLSIANDELRTTAKLGRISFSSGKVVGHDFEVTLRGPNGALIKTSFKVASCRLRWSLFYGTSETGADVWGIDVTGQLKGCTFDGDWWVRTVPAFGGHEGANLLDGNVESDGKFRIIIEEYGVRHFLIIGKGKEPLKVIGLNVTSGKHAEAGVIELKGLCPN